MNDEKRTETVLRATFGAMFLYSGISVLRNPDSWEWLIAKIPESLMVYINPIGESKFLMWFGIAQVVIGAVFLVWFTPKVIVKVAGLVGAILLILTLWFSGFGLATYQYLGLVGGSLSIFFISSKRFY